MDHGRRPSFLCQPICLIKLPFYRVLATSGGCRVVVHPVKKGISEQPLTS